MGTSALQLLDEVQSLARLDAFRVDGFLAQLRDDLAAGDVATLEALESRDQRLRGMLAAVDAFASKSMRIRLAHVLAADTSLGAPFRTYLASEVIAQGGDLDVLRQRVAATAARVDPAGANATATAVVDTAGQVLAARAELRDVVLAIARELAAASLPAAQQAARDRSLDDAMLRRWTAARRDLELLVEQPARLAVASYADRVKALPPLEDVPDDVPEPTRGELLELD